MEEKAIRLWTLGDFEVFDCSVAGENGKTATSPDPLVSAGVYCN